MRQDYQRLLTFAFALVSVGGIARAGIVLYNTRTEFNAATTDRTTIDFEGIAPDGGVISYASPPGVTLSGVNFTQFVPSGALFIIGKNFYFPGNSVISAQHGPVGPTDLTITLAGGFTAFALDYGSFDNSPFSFTLSTGETFTRPTQFVFGFVGLTTLTPITSVRVNSADIVMNFDNVTFGVPVPEPGSSFLIGVGALGLFVRLALRHASPRPRAPNT